MERSLGTCPVYCRTSIQDLINACHVDLSPERLRLHQGESREWTDAQREAHIFATFCENQTTVLARLRNELVGRLFMLWMVFPWLVFPFVDGEATFRRVLLVETVIVLAGGYQLMHALAARKIRPRLQQLLWACHCDMDHLQKWIKTASPRYRALGRHLASWRYNALRRESSSLKDREEPVCERIAIGGFWIN